MSAAPPTLPRRDHHAREDSELGRPHIFLRGFTDPPEVTEFLELVAGQDYAVCARVQLGVSSRAFDHGIYAEKDALPHAFNQTYLAARERT